jgi:hypothetical protein
MAARSEASVCGRSFAGSGFESRRGRGCLSLVNVVCCQMEVSASGRSLFQRNSTECSVSDCDREASTLRRPWPIRGCCAIRGEGGGIIVEVCASKVVPWLRRLVSHLWLRRYRFNPRTVCVVNMLNKMAQGEVFFYTLVFPSQNYSTTVTNTSS